MRAKPVLAVVLLFSIVWVLVSNGVSVRESGTGIICATTTKSDPARGGFVLCHSCVSFGMCEERSCTATGPSSALLGWSCSNYGPHDYVPSSYDERSPLPYDGCGGFFAQDTCDSGTMSPSCLDSET